MSFLVPLILLKFAGAHRPPSPERAYRHPLPARTGSSQCGVSPHGQAPHNFFILFAFPFTSLPHHLSLCCSSPPGTNPCMGRSSTSSISFTLCHGNRSPLLCPICMLYSTFNSHVPTSLSCFSFLHHGHCPLYSPLPSSQYSFPFHFLFSP